ncbi:MAG: carboxypeptidase-like regulatory domain-containing protein, partial [Bacteroidota bacterium]
YLVIPKKLKQPKKLIIGQVVDKKSGEPLAFAHVQTKEKGVLSSQNGRFSLPPNRDTVTLTVSYIGYKKLELKVAPDQEHIKLSLAQNPQELKEVVLTAENEKSTYAPSFFSLNPQQFSSLPMLGETDVFKSMQLLPGIRATDEASSGLVIRGSQPSQNLILMDGFTLYNVDHFFGIFSTLNPNAINNVNVFKGGFGTQYGGRVSSVVDVAGKSGATEKFSGSFGANMLSINGALNIPIGKRTSMLFAFRNSFSDFINSELYKDFVTSSRQNFLESINSDLNTINISPSVEFHDLNAKVQHRFSPNTVFDVNLFVSEDFYNGSYIEEDEFSTYEVNDVSNWSNGGISINLKSQIQSDWYNETTMSASEFKEEENLSISQTFNEDFSFNSDSIDANTRIEFFDYNVVSSIGDVTIKSHNEIDIDEQNSVSTGIEINAISTKYNLKQGFLVEFGTTDTDEFRDTLSVDASIFSFYGSYQFKKNDIVTNLGIRTSHYEPTQKWYLEPRFDIGLQISDRLTLKGAASYHHQFISQTSLSILQNSDQFYWVLSDDDIIPIQKSTHFIFGGNYSFGNWSFDLEYYNKRTDGIIENQFLTLPPGILRELQFQDLNLAGENQSEGLDIFVKYRNTTFTSWLSYTLGTSQDAFWYRNDFSPFPSQQDQRHEINFTNIWKLGKVELSSVFLFGSGRPYTPANPEFSLANDSVSIYDLDKINQSRLPSYTRLDISGKYTFDVGKLNCEVGLTLFNVLNNRNIRSRKFTIRYLFDEQSDEITSDEARVVPLDTNLLGFTPNFFFKIRF